MKPKELIGVILAPFVLIVLGDGVVANVGLGPRLAGPAYNWNAIAFGWGLAVVLSGLIVGADNNPAFTLTNAIRGRIAWSKAITFIVLEIFGAFLGALVVYLVYRDGLVASGMPNVWCTGPGSIFSAASWGGASGAATGSYSLLTACIAEFVGTTILAWGVFATSDPRNSRLTHFGAFIVGGIVLAIGLSLSGPSGYSLNPARDLGPRIFGALAGTQGLFDGLYWLLPPVVIPFLAVPIAGYLFDKFFASEKQ